MSGSTEKTRNCVVFACSGHKYALEAASAARRVKAVMPEIDIVGFADSDGCDIFRRSGFFIEAFEIKDPARSFIDKAEIFLPDYYSRAVFLDTDTYLVHSLDGLFELLDRFELVAAHEPTRFTTDAGYKTLLDGGAPRAFPEFNSGVIGFRNCKRVQHFFESWRRKHAEIEAASTPPIKVDQPSFRLALWESDLAIYVLPPEYNFRHTMPGFIGGYYSAMILHGRTKMQEYYARKLGARSDLPRIHLPFFWIVSGPRRLIRRWRRKHGVSRDGFSRLTRSKHL